MCPDVCVSEGVTRARRWLDEVSNGARQETMMLLLGEVSRRSEPFGVAAKLSDPRIFIPLAGVCIDDLRKARPHGRVLVKHVVWTA